METRIIEDLKGSNHNVEQTCSEQNGKHCNQNRHSLFKRKAKKGERGRGIEKLGGFLQAAIGGQASSPPTSATFFFDSDSGNQKRQCYSHRQTSSCAKEVKLRFDG